MTSQEVIAFSGTSITEANPTGYRPLAQAALQSAHTNVRFVFINSAYSGAATWVRLWYMQADIITNSPETIIYEAVSTYSSSLAQEKAIEEGAIRRLREALPGARILILGLPRYTDNTTPGEINGVQLAHLEALATYYDATFINFADRVQALLDAGTYILSDLYADHVHPSPTGHAELDVFLRETLTLGYIRASDSFTAIGDYPAQYGGDTFDDTSTYVARNGTDNDGETGTGWTTSGTTRISSTALDTITFTGTFESYGIDLLIDNDISIEKRIDGGGWSTSNFISGDRNVNLFGYLTRGVHTVDIRVVSGTVKVQRFLAI